MTIEIRDPQFASHVDQIANTIQWPDASFALSPLEAVVGFVVTLYAGFSKPDPVMLQHALRGIAF